MTTLIMGTRGSALALAQSRQFAAQLENRHPGLRVEERIIRTTGDMQQGVPLPQIGGKGVFTLEIEQALLNREIDFAVHSLKDLPPLLPAGLCLACTPKRQDAGDVCLVREAGLSQTKATLPFLPLGAKVGTSSLRRRAQLLALRPDIEISDVRGNIDTRLKKLQSGGYDAIILAAAGLNRLELDLGESQLYAFEQRDFVPAPGQGALAIEAREGDDKVLPFLKALEDAASLAEVSAERAAMSALNAGCSTPLGARAVVDGDSLHLWAAVLSEDGRRRVFVEEKGEAADAIGLGQRVAQKLLDEGAGELLA